MIRFLAILILVCAAWAQSGAGPQNAPAATTPGASQPLQPANPADENTRKAHTLVDQAIQALGGQTYLTLRDREQNGRGYTFHHGRPTSGGDLFWSFVQFPDKERVEYTKERDIARVFVGKKGYEITYKG
ncbi:MAG TPA: hypothetical protein VMR80_02635, partial [Candidatus Acidoferrum sp.]|nr:hypothetical protein [Candidatus Acidoferrum sp.]